MPNWHDSLDSLRKHAARISERTGLTVTVEPFGNEYGLTVARADGESRHGGYSAEAIHGMLLGITAALGPNWPPLCNVASTRATGADIEIIDPHQGVSPVLIPSALRINGTDIKMPAAATIRIREIGDGVAVTVTPTMYARRLTITADHDV
ncbi:hypothetical protein [Streptomyces sp. NPDC088258]|uniref:hypothetical protein n=1 Tax=Streptomyces sp. NPDC088258 TaxID=3365849 RepID=UPI00382264D3